VPPTITQSQTEALLAVIRLGDADRLGWWRSHSVDDVAEYHLSHALPTTWMAAGVELAMESARIRHHTALERPSAVHLFSDRLPFHRELKAWLIGRKLERDFEPLEWLLKASIENLRARLGEPNTGERRGNGIYMGDFTGDQLDNDHALHGLLARLTSAYVTIEKDFVAPYADLM
jgi:hypothetical protein